MKFLEHESSSLLLFGRPFKEVHEFIDRYSGKYRGMNHRRVLHHHLGISMVGHMFGPLAHKAATLHVYEDLYIGSDPQLCEQYLGWVELLRSSGEEMEHAVFSPECLGLPATWVSWDKYFFPLGDEEYEMESDLIELFGEDMYNLIEIIK